MKTVRNIFNVGSFISSYFVNKITTLPVLTSFFILIFLLSILTHIKLKYFQSDSSFNEGLLIEFYGTAFEIFIISFIVLWINKHGEINKENQNYQRDLYDLQRIISPETILMKIISIRRLNRNGITNVDLEGNSIVGADLQGVILSGANLKHCNVSRCNLKHAILHEANLQNANLTEADLYNADFQNADLTDAIVTHEQLMHAKTLYNAKIDKQILGKIKQKEQDEGVLRLFQPAYYWASKRSKSKFHMQR